MKTDKLSDALEAGRAYDGINGIQFSTRKKLQKPKKAKVSNKMSKKSKIAIADSDITKLDKEILEIEKNPKSLKDALPLVTNFLPWCPSCESAIIDQRGYACDNCGKTVCRNCIEISKDKNICYDCLKQSGVSPKKYSQISSYNPRLMRWYILIAWGVPLAILLGMLARMLLG